MLRIFSYLPNPRVWKAQIAGALNGAEVEVLGAKPPELATWLWDYDARPLPEAERTDDSPYARQSKRGFSSTLYKTDEFLAAHPFGTVPAAFAGDGQTGVFESNSILRAVARAGDQAQLYGHTQEEASRIDSFLDANLVFPEPTFLQLQQPGKLRTETISSPRSSRLPVSRCNCSPVAKKPGLQPWASNPAFTSLKGLRLTLVVGPRKSLKSTAMSRTG